MPGTALSFPNAGTVPVAPNAYRKPHAQLVHSMSAMHALVPVEARSDTVEAVCHPRLEEAGDSYCQAGQLVHQLQLHSTSDARALHQIPG